MKEEDATTQRYDSFNSNEILSIIDDDDDDDDDQQQQQH